MRCPACGEWPDYCQGHGEIGDPMGFEILESHDKGDHYLCDELACDPFGTPDDDGPLY